MRVFEQVAVGLEPTPVRPLTSRMPVVARFSGHPALSEIRPGAP